MNKESFEFNGLFGPEIKNYIISKHALGSYRVSLITAKYTTFTCFWIILIHTI